MNQSKVLIYEKNEKHRAFFLGKLIIRYFNILIFNGLAVFFILIAAYIIHYTVTLSAFIEMQNIKIRLIPEGSRHSRKGLVAGHGIKACIKDQFK